MASALGVSLVASAGSLSCIPVSLGSSLFATLTQFSSLPRCGKTCRGLSMSWGLRFVGLAAAALAGVWPARVLPLCELALSLSVGVVLVVCPFTTDASFASGDERLVVRPRALANHTVVLPVCSASLGLAATARRVLVKWSPRVSALAGFTRLRPGDGRGVHWESRNAKDAVVDQQALIMICL